MQSQSVLVGKICLTSSHIIALSSTIFRLYRRIYTRRWWWDDATACLALISDCAYLASLWSPTNLVPTQAARTHSFWFSTLSFLFVIGFVRISLALSLARIFPSWQTTHRISMYMAIGFALIYGSLIIIMAVYCGIPHAIVWDPAFGMVQCRSVNRVVFSVIGVDIMSDVFLVAIPLTTLWRLKLPRNQRRLVLAGFSSGIWTTAASVAATVVILRFSNNSDDTFSRAVLPHVEAIVSLLSCNFLVTITTIYKVFWKVEDLEGSSSDSAQSRDTSEPRRYSSNVAPTAIILTDLSDLALEDSSFHGTLSPTPSTESFEGNPIVFSPGESSHTKKTPGSRELTIQPQ